MNAAYEAMYPTDDVDEAFAIAACAFGSLKMLWSGTPTFQRLTRPIS